MSCTINTDFQRWKVELEKQTNSWFVQDSGEKPFVGCRKTYYYCNRSGPFHNKATGQRRSKMQGTSKISAHCTASITLSKAEDNALRVEVHTTHYGHEKSLGYLRLTDSERAAIAGQLAQDVDFLHILHNIRDSLGTEFKRIYFLTRKDITMHPRLSEPPLSGSSIIRTSQKINYVILKRVYACASYPLSWAWPIFALCALCATAG